MDFWNNVTGRDLKKRWKSIEARVKNLPREDQAVWEQISAFFWRRPDGTGRNTLHILEGVLELMEEACAKGRSTEEVFGGDIEGFCEALAGEEGAKSFQDHWRDQLNQSILRKLGR